LVGWHSWDEGQKVVGDIVIEGEGVESNRGSSPIVAGFIVMIIPCFLVYFNGVEFRGRVISFSR
jgi:hypothetical protein